MCQGKRNINDIRLLASVNCEAASILQERSAIPYKYMGGVDFEGNTVQNGILIGYS